MGKKIYVSPSDQTKNLYAGVDTNEAAECRKIALCLVDALVRCGFEAKTSITGGMYDRVRESDSWGADIHLPIHTNAFNGKVMGTRIFSWDTSGVGYKVSKAIMETLAPITIGTSDNVTAYPSLYEINTPKAATSYVEVAFHDNAEEAKWIVEHTEDIAEAICKGVCNYYGQAYKAKVEEPKEEKTITQIAREVLKGKWGNGAARKANLTTAGYDYNAVQTEVNRLVNSGKKSNETIAKEVIQGKWGNGADRKNRLTKAGYDHNAIQNIVNRLLK